MRGGYAKGLKKIEKKKVILKKILTIMLNQTYFIILNTSEKYY